ncbi:MAG TPA: GNAT family N-acetyltransferase [Bacteroidales bacterium]|nr:GNAT family N-acetyltransferase [Bacteroidales bacterium]HPS17030.1 GNAT family N-acetyltransferase [Bacteroidales bacterium]
MEIKYREEVLESDIANVREIIESSGFFHSYEIDVAVELVEERLKKGKESGYYFIFAEQNGKTIGYTCFGNIPCTLYSFDLYWIAVHNDFRSLGLGKILMDKTETAIKQMGGKAIYIETSSQEKYIPTQKFYDKCNCELIARFTDFYADGDDKLVYRKKV